LALMPRVRNLWAMWKFPPRLTDKAANRYG